MSDLPQIPAIFPEPPPTHRVSIKIGGFNQRIDFEPTSDSLENYWVTITYMAVGESSDEQVDRILVPSARIAGLFEWWASFPTAEVDFDPDRKAPGMIRI